MFPRRRTASKSACRTIALAARATIGLTALALALAAGPLIGQEPPVAPVDAPPSVPTAPPPSATPPPTPPAAPKSLLPDTFGPTVAAPTVAPTPLNLAPRAPAPDAVATADAKPQTDAIAPPGGPAIDGVGPLTPDLGGYGADAFAGTDGRFAAGLLRRLRVPVASRWAHIVLGRALLTRAAAPAGINPGDWLAERARTLLAMGEVDGAKRLVDNLNVDRFTPRLVRVAGQVNFAAADLPGLCPIAASGGAVSVDPVWQLADAMCAGMAGDDITAASDFDALRDGAKVDPFDVQLGERIALISGAGGRAANVDWDAVAGLTPYRFGVAVAAGVAVPLAQLERLAVATRGASWGWVLRAPGQAAAVRDAALVPAVAIGIVSADAMVASISAGVADLDREALDASPAGTLRQAYAAATTAARVAAMRTIWSRGAGDAGIYAAYVETGIAAARLPVDPGVAADAPDLIAAMMSAGIEDRAARWWPVVRDRDDAAGRRGWALLAAGANGGIAVSSARFRDWAADVSPHRAALLLAALTGFGDARGGGWDRLRADLGIGGAANSWTRAIDAAGTGRRPGEVAVLAATALQSNWAAVPPAHFAHIISAYMAVGRAHEAHMLAAEAVTRG